MKFAIVELVLVPGDWGAQIAWVSVDIQGAVPGLRLHRFPVFRQADTGAITIGMPLVPGDGPGARYSGISFDTDAHRERFLTGFLKELVPALEAACPELFAPEQRL
jgi:hypothetical protein